MQYLLLEADLSQRRSATSHKTRRAGWDTPYQQLSALSIRDAILALIENDFPGLTFSYKGSYARSEEQTNTYRKPIENHIENL